MTTDTTYRWPHKDLLDVTQLDAQDVRHLLNVAASFQEINLRPVKKVPTLKGKTVVLFFVENSTRTKTSFDVAGKRLSCRHLLPGQVRFQPQQGREPQGHGPDPAGHGA